MWDCECPRRAGWEMRRKTPSRTQTSGTIMAAMVETETIIKLSLNVPPRLVLLPPLWPETGRSTTTVRQEKARENRHERIISGRRFAAPQCQHDDSNRFLNSNPLQVGTVRELHGIHVTACGFLVRTPTRSTRRVRMGGQHRADHARLKHPDGCPPFGPSASHLSRAQDAPPEDGSGITNASR